MKLRTAQKGYREYLLCEGCEDTLNQYERVFADLWSRVVGRIAIPERMLTVNGLDYRATKLTHLSVLWRFHIAQGFGRHVDLGPYAEVIREMLLSGDPGDEDHLPVLGRLLVDDQCLVMDRLVCEPNRARVDHSYVYFAQYAGAEWFCVMARSLEGKLRQVLAPFILRQSGRVRFMTGHYRESLTWEMVVEEMRACKRF